MIPGGPLTKSTQCPIQPSMRPGRTLPWPEGSTSDIWHLRGRGDRSNPRGTHFERWRHINGCGRFFNAVRDTVSDKFVMTYRAGEPRPNLDALKEAAE